MECVERVLQGLSNAVPSRWVGVERPVYTLFTPACVAAARRERSPRVHSAAQFLAEQEVSPPPPSSDSGTRDLPAATLFFYTKNEVGYTLCGSLSSLFTSLFTPLSFL